MRARAAVRSLRASALAMSLVIGAIALTPAQTSAATKQTQAKGRWTFLYYMDGDNNLEADELEDMTRMAAARATGDIKVLALIDRSPENTSHKMADGSVVPDDNLGSIRNFNGAKLVQIVDGDFKILKEADEIDMGSAQTWAWFLKAGMQMFPAEHYAAVISNHGGGIDGAAWDDSTSKSAHLSLDDVANGVKAALAGAKEDKLDVLGFAACLMGHFDMAAKLAPYVSYLVASEEVTVGRQWDDTAFIRAAMDHLNATGPELGKAVVDAMARTRPDYAGRTYSTIDLGRMGQISQAVKSLATALKGTIKETAPALDKAQRQTLHFGLNPGEADTKSLYDIGDLVAHLQGVRPEVTTAANALWEATRRAVLNNGTGTSAAAATGLAIYLPASAADHSADYAAQAAVREWSDMLNAYTGGAPPVANDGTPDFQGKLTLDVKPDGVLVTGTLKSGTGYGVVAATLFSGRIQPNGDIHYLAVAPAGFVGGDPLQITGQWNFRYAQVGDGVKTLDTTLYLYLVGGSILAKIPMLYQGPDGKQLAASIMFALDPATGAVTDPPHCFVFGSTGGVAELAGPPGSLLAPLVLVTNPGGGPVQKLISDQALDATRCPQVTGAKVPSGTPFIEVMVAADKPGNAAVSQAIDTIP